MKNKNLRVFLPYGEAVITCATMKEYRRDGLICYDEKNLMVAKFFHTYGYMWAPEWE